MEVLASLIAGLPWWVWLIAAVVLMLTLVVWLADYGKRTIGRPLRTRTRSRLLRWYLERNKLFAWNATRLQLLTRNTGEEALEWIEKHFDDLYYVVELRNNGDDSLAEAIERQLRDKYREQFDGKVRPSDLNEVLELLESVFQRIKRR